MFFISGSFAALIIFLTAFFTICLCICSLKIIYKNVALRNSFGFICIIQCLSDFGMAVFGAFWAAPTLLFSFSNLPISKDMIGFGVGHFVLLLFYFSLWLHLCKSLNRCFAIILPIPYHLKATIKNTKIVIILIMGLSILSLSSSFIPECNYYFNIANYHWQSRNIDCLKTIGKYTTLFITSVTVIGSVICDLITFSYLIMFNKKIKLQQSQGQNLYNEKKFFAQTFCTTLISFLSTIITFFFANDSFSISINFLLTTFNWQLFTLLNELIFILFTIKMKDVAKRFSIFSTNARVNAATAVPANANENF